MEISPHIFVESFKTSVQIIEHTDSGAIYHVHLLAEEMDKLCAWWAKAKSISCGEDHG